MKQILIVMLCFLMLTSMAIAHDGVKIAEERVINLPRDGGQWYLSIFGDKSDLKFQILKHWVETYPGLANLKSQVHFNIYSTDNVRYQRYEPTLPGKVCIRLQNSEGVVTSEFWDEYIPMTPGGLYRGIREDITDKASWGCLRRRRCRPQPQPEPNPEPILEPVIDKPPVLPENPKSSFPWLLAILSGVTGAGIGIAQGYKDEHAGATLV